MDQNDDIDIQPWPVAELVGQLVAHIALGRRGLIELDAGTDIFERETDRFELEAWARLELTSWLSNAGFDVLGAPIGDLDADALDLCADCLIVASTIAWGIRAFGEPILPLPSDGAPEKLALDWAPGPWTPVRNAFGKARVRSDKDLATERERWEIIHWRTTLFEDPAMAADDRHALHELLGEIAPESAIRTADGDLAVDDGVPFRRLGGDALATVQREAELRLRSLNWVCGFGESPESAPLYLDD